MLLGRSRFPDLQECRQWRDRTAPTPASRDRHRSRPQSEAVPSAPRHPPPAAVQPTAPTGPCSPQTGAAASPTAYLGRRKPHRTLPPCIEPAHASSPAVKQPPPEVGLLLRPHRKARPTPHLLSDVRQSLRSFPRPPPTSGQSRSSRGDRQACLPAGWAAPARKPRTDPPRRRLEHVLRFPCAGAAARAAIPPDTVTRATSARRSPIALFAPARSPPSRLAGPRPARTLARFLSPPSSSRTPLRQQ